ncbi:hypothetical protein B0G74_3823 [Paraburkholderia sp. BL9I2N2]|nr:hypothetical protein B0G74_3823 [Paraburkholderia sp. BL9I2N2]
MTAQHFDEVAQRPLREISSRTRVGRTLQALVVRQSDVANIVRQERPTMTRGDNANPADLGFGQGSQILSDQGDVTSRQREERQGVRMSVKQCWNRMLASQLCRQCCPPVTRLFTQLDEQGF